MYSEALAEELMFRGTAAEIEIHNCTSEREKPAVGQQCRADQSTYVRDGVTAVADWMSTDVHRCVSTPQWHGKA